MKNRFPKSIVALIVFMTVLTGTFVCVHAVESTESAGYGTETSVTFDAASTTLEQTYVVNTTKKTTNAVTNTTSVPSTSGLAYTTTPQQTEKKDRYYPPFSGYNDYGDGWGSITRMYEYDSNPYTQGYVPTNLPLTTNDNGYPVCAQCGEDVYWQLFVETGELIISGYGDMYNMEIPQWWESRDYIKKIIINDGVTNIGFFAFADCSQLSEVIIGNSVETIGAFAFSECVSLKSIVIPDSVKSIDSMAFYGCTSLESIAMSSNIEHLGRDSFKNTGYCNNPENRENGVLYIGNCLVYANNSDYLKSETYEIKDGTRVIAPGAFMSTDAESVIIPESVVEIGECAFRWTELTSIEIPKGVKVIEKGAFDFCYSLETVYISDSVEIIEEDAFYDCPSLSQIIVDENNPNFVVDEYGALFSTDKSLLIQFPANKSIESYTVPAQTKRIANYAFNKSKINGIIFNDGLESIGTCTFSDCDSIESVKIPDSVTVVEDGAFCRCDNLKTFDTGNGVKELCSNIFSNSASVEYIIIGENVSSCEYALRSCSELKNITVNSENQYYSSDEFGVLFNKEKTKLLKYPSACSEEKYTVPDSTVAISYQAFARSAYLKELYISKNVSSIDDSYNIYDNGLLNNSVEKFIVDEENKYYSSDENGVVFDKKKEILIKYPSSNTRNSFAVPEGVVSISPEAFYCSKHLSDISLPNSVKYIGADAFSGCESLSSISIPYGVSRIMQYDFYQCTNLETLYLPASLTRIDNMAFYMCDSIKDIYYTGSEEEWNNIYIESNNTEYINKATIHYMDTEDVPETTSSSSDVSSDNETTFPYETTTTTALQEYIYGALKYVIQNGKIIITDCDETAMGEVVIPTGIGGYTVAIIGDNAFEDCSGITSVVIPQGVTSVCSHSFAGCINLKAITLPAGIDRIGNFAFDECGNLSDVYFGGNEDKWNTITIAEGNECLINADIHLYEALKTGDIIEFGSYPQSEVTDIQLINELNSQTLNWISYEYYQNTDTTDLSSTSPQDIMEYADIEYDGEKYRAVKITEYRTDSTYHAFNNMFDGFQLENGYSSEKVYWFKYEPLKWKVLDPDKGLVVCASIIDSQPFNNLQEEKDGEYYGDKNYNNYSNDYTSSSIRAWLNDDFYNIAFTDAEKSGLIATTLDNSGYDSENNKYNYSESTDNVFLLSFDEMSNEEYGFSPDRLTESNSRMATGTDYANCQGLCVYGNGSTDEYEQFYGNSYYWLRTAGKDYSFYSCIATYAGTVSWAGDVSDTYIGVRPAVSIDLSNYNKSEKEIGIAGESTNIAIGETARVSLVVISGDVLLDNITWNSSNPEVATINSNGNSADVIAVSKGKTTITATTAEGITATYTINVYQPVAGIILDKTNITIPINKTEQLVASIMPEDADNQKVHWDTDNYDVASVSNGLVTAKEAGTAIITARTDDGSKTDSCVVTVVTPVTGVKLSSANLTLIKGKSGQLTAEILPWDATDKSLTWSSSDTSIAVIDKSGKITTNSTGTVTITVKTNDGGYTASCSVNVINQPVTGITLNKTSVSIVKGKTNQLTATITPSDAFNKNVTWSSSNSSVATVNSSGKVTAKSIGTATISVKTQDGGFIAECSVTVKNDTINVTGVSLNKSKTTIFVGKTEKLSSTVKPSDATNKSVTWASSDSSVASVDSSGKITANKKGTAIITVKTTDGSKTAKCTVTVKPYNENISKTGTFVLGSEKYEQSVKFDANWLNNNSYDYNHDIAQFCSLVSLLTYSSLEDMRTGINNIGFKTFEKDLDGKARVNVIANNDTVIYWPNKADTVYNRNCFVITRKDYVMNGENHSVVLVMLRGTYGNEWYSNFDPWGRLDGNSSYGGDNHYSFNQAALFVKGYLDSYMESNKLYNNNNVEIIITGHSRGAAVANLLGAKIVSGTDLSPYPDEENIFTYTFASPNVSKDPSRSFSTYENIFNFVNPEDFVTKCLPAKWEYGRYGITLTLPSKTNESKSSYNKYYSNMNLQFRKYTGEDYKPYKNGEETVYNVVSEFCSDVKNVSDFYNKYFKITIDKFNMAKYSTFEFFNAFICPFPAGDSTSMNVMSAITLASFSSGAHREIIWLFINHYVMDCEFEHAHQAETYASFLMSMNYNQAYTWAKGAYRKGYNGTVNCPVDVEVYNKDTGELVGRIVNNVVDEAVASGENSIVMTVEGDSKSYWLPANGNYEVRLIGNGEGIMNHTVSEIDGDIGEIRRINFADVTVAEGFEMCSEYIEEDFELENLVLTTELGETIEKTELLEEDSLQTLSVNVSVEGVGNASGRDAVTKGDYILLEATTDENNSFLGWYINGELISENEEYGFVITDNIDIIARFTNIIIDTEDISFSESEILLDLTGENSWKKLNVSVSPDNATYRKINWESSNPEIAKVNQFGIVEAVSAGTAVIMGTINNSDNSVVSESCKVTVNAREYAVKWNIDGAITEQFIKEGSEIIPPESPSKEGYVFVGWSPDIPEVMPDYDLIFNAVFEHKSTVRIISPSVSVISYGDSIILHAEITGELPAGARIDWTSSNDNFEMKVSEDGKTCKISPKSSGDTTFTVIVFDSDGSEFSSDTQQMTAKAGIWQKIVAFFKKIFGLTKTIPEAFKGIYN